MEEKSFTSILQKMKNTKRYRNESCKSKLQTSNSDTNFIIDRESEKRQIAQDIIKTKSKNNYNNISFKQNHSSNCKNCHSFHKLLKKDKNALSNYIENNLKYLKLFGNQRYNENSPSLFVQDYKKKLSEKKMGLVPIPDKKNKKKSVNNSHKLYNLQRSIVMVRRYQYAKTNFLQGQTSNESFDITLIQKWWKKISKIIVIQKIFRGYFIRKQVNAIINLHRFMKQFENTIIKMKIKNAFDKIFKSIVIRGKKIQNVGHFINKDKLFFFKILLMRIMMLQNNFRIFKARKKYKKLLRDNKYIVRNPIEFISKINYNMNEIFKKIIIIQYNIRKFLKNKNFIDKKVIHKNIGIYYIDKNYIDDFSKKVILFYKLIRHALQILSIKRLKIKYKNIDKYNEDDINKVVLIQKSFLNYYHNKNIILINVEKQKICFFYKIRLIENINKIILIQKKYREYLLNKNKFHAKIIRNKPISSIKIINSIKKSIFHKIKYKNNDKLVNDICYISKENKINNINKILFLQTKIYSFLFLKNLKKNAKNKLIDKNDYKLCFIIKKYYMNENYCINKIKKIQKLYKKQYKYLKNNIIEYFNSLENNKDEPINKEKSINNNLINNLKKNNIDKNNKSNNTISKKYSQSKNEIYMPPKGNNYKDIIHINTFKTQKINKNSNLNKIPNNKYYTKFNKNNIQNEGFIKNKNDNLNQIKDKKNKKYEGIFNKSIQKKNKLTLRELIKKNKIPRKELKGNYISKKRVEKNKNENYLDFNLKIYKKLEQIPIQISKTRLLNNEKEIVLIQTFWRKICNLNPLKKPLIYFSKEKEIDYINFENEKKNNKNNYIAKKFSSKNRNKLPFIKQNNIFDLSNNTNKSKFMQNTYDNDEPYELNNSINNKNKGEINSVNFYLNKSKDNFFNNISNCNYIRYIIFLQKYLKDFLYKKLKFKKLNLAPLIISKYRIKSGIYNKYITFIKERNIIIKIPKNEKIINDKKIIQNNNLLSFSENNLSEKQINEINNDINYISKKRYYNNIQSIEIIQRNWRKRNKNKICNKRVRIKKCIISKNRTENNIEKILKIQRLYRERIFKKNENKKKIISRREILFESIYKEKQKKLDKKKNGNNLIKKNSNKNLINRKNKYIKKNLNNNKKENYELNLNNVKNNNKDNLKINNISININSNSSFEDKKKEFSYSKINYISKIYKILVFKKNVDIQGINFISKEYKQITYEKKNLFFILLLALFITKNTQEFIFYLLKYNNKSSFTYPFYNRVLQRVIKFLKSFPYPTQGGEKIKKFFSKIFPNLYTQTSYNILITSLNKEDKQQLVNTNIYNSIEPDFINYICSFSKYDKQLSNSIFIETRLKNSKLISTNIFNITRFIDDEYNNLINGKYCHKCFLDINKCICNKKKEDEYYYDEGDGIDIDFDIDYYNKSKFGYDSTKCKGITINRRPKAEEVYEDPITNLILRKKDDYIDSKGQIYNSKINSKNMSESQFESNSSFATNFNSKILNKIKNNIGSENNSLNNSKSIAKIKEIYHQNHIKKKENLILIKNIENSD